MMGAVETGEIAVEISNLQAKVGQLTDSISKVVQGKSDVVELATIALLANGHLLIEDVPGIGKTTMAYALARSLDCTFRRIQFTSDLLPSDLTGLSIFNQLTQEFEFRRGPLFANIVLADEINRTTPKTQSALLEAMSEGRVTVEDLTYRLPRPFMVVATQNPAEHHGTYPLPESQLDRFLMRIRMGYPGVEDEKRILRQQISYDAAEDLTAAITASEIQEFQSRVKDVAMVEDILTYLMEIVRATRSSKKLDLGVSPRGAMGLYRAAQARAVIQGRPFCVPDDVKILATPVLAHRVVVSAQYTSPLSDTDAAEHIVRSIVESMEIPG